jgi:hypothetical protein
MENELLKRIELKEYQAKKRAFLFTLIPLFAGIFLIIYTSKKVIEADEHLKVSSTTLKKIKIENDLLKTRNDSLSQTLTESVITLGKAVSVTTEFKKFIDKMKPELRSQSEASFFINFKMLEDRVRGEYEYLSQRVSTLPRLDENRTWIVIVQSSLSLEDLKIEAAPLITIYGEKQIGIFRDEKGNYALSVKGNGTFTRAYRLNVELRDKYNYWGAYFSNSQDWGVDYLKN